MIRNAFLITVLTVFGAALAGCHLYFEDDGGGASTTYCDNSGCYYCDDWGCYPTGGGGQPGWDCNSNYDCAAGCFCQDSGTCAEAGFCTTKSDCSEGFECDDRSSCVPEGSSESCTSDSACPSGSYCDEAAGNCVGSWTCDANSSANTCGMGFECDDRGTCVPQPCSNDEMCQEGCYCNEDAGECIETTTCDALGQCSGDFVCDPDRNTCVPPGEIGPTCQGNVTCNTAAPVCPVGSTAVIEDGCYTGQCMVKSSCPDGAPFECSDLNNNENSCISNPDCSPVYTGLNCTSPNGNECTTGSANCTCQSFEYGYCEA